MAKDTPDVKTTDKEEESLKTSNTDNMKTTRGSEKLVADPVKGQPVEHREGKPRAGEAFKKEPSVEQVAIDTLQNVD